MCTLTNTNLGLKRVNRNYYHALSNVMALIGWREGDSTCQVRWHFPKRTYGYYSECESNAVSLSLYYNRNIQRRIGSISYPTANQIRDNTLANHAHDLRDFNTLPTELVFTGIVYWEVQ